MRWFCLVAAACTPGVEKPPEDSTPEPTDSGTDEPTTDSDSEHTGVDVEPALSAALYVFGLDLGFGPATGTVDAAFFSVDPLTTTPGTTTIELDRCVVSNVTTTDPGTTSTTTPTGLFLDPGTVTLTVDGDPQGPYERFPWTEGSEISLMTTGSAEFPAVDAPAAVVLFRPPDPTTAAEPDGSVTVTWTPMEPPPAGATEFVSISLSGDSVYVSCPVTDDGEFVVPAEVMDEVRPSLILGQMTAFRIGSEVLDTDVVLVSLVGLGADMGL